MTKFTLHSSCFTALRDNAPEAGAIRALVAAQKTDDVDVAIVANAEPIGTNSPPISTFAQFGAELKALGLDRLTLLHPIAYFDLAFPEWSLRGTEELEDVEREIHSILFPTLHYAWKDFAKANQIAASTPPQDSPWRQAKYHVQSLLAHIENQRHCFVTLDANIHRGLKKRQLIDLGAFAIEYPAQAAMMI